MLKKLLFTFLILLSMYSTAVIAYRLFEPQTDTTYKRSDYIAYDSLKDYLAKAPSSIHYLFFFDANSSDSVYVNNTVISTVEKDTNLSLSSILETVDLTAVDDEEKVQRLSDEWGIGSTPAFLTVTVQDGEATMTNKLEWDGTSPMSAKDVEEWLTKNGLYMQNK